MKKNNIIKLSLATILSLQIGVLAETNTNKNTNSLESVEIISSDEKEESYTVESMSTSTKLNLSIKDTPQSVSVITSAQLNDMGITNYDELLGHISGVTLNRWDERVQPSARGFVLDYYKIDGVPVYEEYSSREIDLSLYERVEIVRGANGLTTGSGNPGMSINLVRKKADSDILKVDLSLEVDSEKSKTISADVRSSLSDDGKVRGRFVLNKEDAESFMDGYEKDKKSLYGVIDVDLGDKSKISTGLSYEKTKKEGVRWGGLPAFYTDGTQTDFDRSEIISEDWTYSDTEIKSAFLDFEHYLNNDSILNIDYSYSQIRERSALFYIAGAVDKTSTVGNTYYTWLQDRIEKIHNIDVNTNIPYKIAGLENEIVVGATMNVSKIAQYDGAFGGGYLSDFYDYDIVEPTSLPTYEEPSKTTQTGLYFTNRTQIADNQKLITGARISSHKFESEDSTIANRVHTGELVPFIGYVFDVTKETSLYASYTNIFNPQTNIDENGNVLDPEYGNTFEIGTKGEYFDKDLTTSFTIFKTVQENTAEEVDGVLYNGATTYTAEDVKSKGFEFDVSGKVTDAFTLDFGLAHFKAINTDGDNFNTKASRTTANLFGKYKINDLTFGGGVDYKSKIYAEDATYGTITQKAYYLFNAMMTYDIDSNFKVQLNIKNIFDKKYYEGIASNGMAYGAPRTATATLSYKF